MKLLAATVQAHLANYTTGNFQVYSEDKEITIFAELNPNIFKPGRIGIQIVDLPNPFFRVQIDIISYQDISDEFAYAYDIKKRKLLANKTILKEMVKHAIFVERINDIVNLSDVIGEIKFYTPPESTEPFTRVVVLIKDDRIFKETEVIIDLINASLDIHHAILEIIQKIKLKDKPRFCWRCGARIEGEGYYCPICGVKL